MPRQLIVKPVPAASPLILGVRAQLETAIKN
jgi:hypothetical protein